MKKLMTVEVIARAGSALVTEFASGVVPPSPQFPYWTIYWQENGEDKATFINMENVTNLTITGGDIEDGPVRQDKVPSMRDGLRAV